MSQVFRKLLSNEGPGALLIGCTTGVTNIWIRLEPLSAPGDPTKHQAIFRPSPHHLFFFKGKKKITHTAGEKNI